MGVGAGLGALGEAVGPCSVCASLSGHRGGDSLRWRLSRVTACGSRYEVAPDGARGKRILCHGNDVSSKRRVARYQHSTIFTASPPREVSLYLVFMSAPVCRIVLMTESSET